MQRPLGDEQTTGDWPWPDSLDAVCAAPGSHRVLLENERVRVLEVTIAAGHKEPWHTHRRWSLMLVDQCAAIRYFRSEHEFDERQRRLSESGLQRLEWLPPEGIHSIENIDVMQYHALRIELK
jgi:predicted metal-dependent enzyme (double-stranded beta helix superfamily)